MTIKEMLVIALFGILVIFSPWSRSSIPECGMDVNIVYQARKAGITKEELLADLAKAGLPEKRSAFIKNLIEDAYSKSFEDFGKDAFPACGG